MTLEILWRFINNVQQNLFLSNGESFRQNLLEITWKILKKFTDEKPQHHFNRAAAKISALPSDKINNNEYLTGKEMLPSGPSQIIQQAKFTYSPLGKTFKKQKNTTTEYGDKQTKAIKD